MIRHLITRLPSPSVPSTSQAPPWPRHVTSSRRRVGHLFRLRSPPLSACTAPPQPHGLLVQASSTTISVTFGCPLTPAPRPHERLHDDPAARRHPTRPAAATKKTSLCAPTPAALLFDPTSASTTPPPLAGSQPCQPYFLPLRSGIGG
jgi:hypothetical protein